MQSMETGAFWSTSQVFKSVLQRKLWLCGGFEWRALENLSLSAVGDLLVVINRMRMYGDGMGQTLEPQHHVA